MRRRPVLLTGAALGALGLLAACAPGSDSGGGDASDGGAAAPSADEVVTDVASLGDVTLVVWDQEVRGAQNDAITALIDAFQEKYPNITVERQSQSFDDLQQQTGLALSGNDVPDVLQVNNARGDMGTYVADQLLTDLSGYAEAYGWEDRFSASVLGKMRYSEDGVTFGEGNLYGLAQTGEVCGIYYSQAKLDALGLEAPTTWEEVFALVDAASAAGEQPIMLGNLDQWPALHVFGPLQANYVPADEIVTLGMGNAGAAWTDDANGEALAKLAEWGSSGALGDSPNGLAYDDAWPLFTKGTGVLLIGGSWLGPDMEAVMGEDLRFMAPPPGVDGGVATTGGTGIPFSIPAAAANKDAAAAYIDFITSDDAMALIAENGGMPVNRTAELAPESGVNKDIYEAFDAVSTEGTLLPYLDYATPSFADTAGATLQEVIGGQTDPVTAAQALQEDYAAFTEGS
ncbi:ABC transporter substrate-binding protein [Brachybacterium aquaticum]|uniref:Raffinose/stachyose/melibiose transport system substrate-binding protein n=1 Tax=Brachybacterium aquaticum TaxID=1432564 RepID=A0A841AIN7_9MICO|nr:extracellular solute-binding protein [Brachybacterium aquaticum]MBB5832898.1 raffinose/stachyose/melibiose transport system substrate-binding protein [Brachybacterium aquaticum]